MIANPQLSNVSLKLTKQCIPTSVNKNVDREKLSIFKEKGMIQIYTRKGGGQPYSV